LGEDAEREYFYSVLIGRPRYALPGRVRWGLGSWPAYQAQLGDLLDGRGPVPDPKLAVRSVQLVADGAGAYVESLCHLGVGESFGDEREDLDLPGAKDTPGGRSGFFSGSSMANARAYSSVMVRPFSQAVLPSSSPSARQAGSRLRRK
jgi:hypothetical protein